MLTPSAKLKIALKQRGLTQKRLAALIGYRFGYVRNVMSGFSTSPAIRKAIERELGLSIWPAETNQTTKEN